jgi:histidinol-phosphate aminotransferase
MNAPVMNTLAPRPSILTIEPYVGGESKIPGVNRIIKLSSTRAPSGRPQGHRGLCGQARGAAPLPGPQRQGLAGGDRRRFGLDPARIVCGNGSDELIAHLCLAYGGEGTEIVMSAYGFMMYDIAARYAGCRVLKVAEHDMKADIDGMIAAAAGPRVAHRLHHQPEQPDRHAAALSEIARLRAGLRDDVLLVMDSAYAEYVTDPATIPARRWWMPPATPSCCAPSPRSSASAACGWAGAMPPEIIDTLNRVRGPFNVAAASQAAAVAALAEEGLGGEVHRP